MKILLGTDVILDVLMDRQPFSSDAAEILSLGESGQIKIYITAITVSNIYYILRKKFKHKKILNQLKSLMAIVEISQIDKSVIIEALTSKFSDFEDSLQHFSANKENDIDYIITRNTKDFKFSEIKVKTPEQFLNSSK